MDIAGGWIVLALPKIEFPLSAEKISVSMPSIDVEEF